ncbi:MAG: bifunctional glycosyltransferase family 2/GtrA family protein [Eubacteriales bacterium]|nr:bifunctional glycosyltransferase family 2/GtrA family protein [Eubacteriales bacterium]
MIKEIIVIIPAYKPSEGLISFVDKLMNFYDKILIVDDGSGLEYEKVFDTFNDKKFNQKVFVFKHIKNMGKGRAQKDAINYSFNIFKEEIENNEIKGFASVDADGQHDINDIINCSNVFLKNQESLVLGQREFKKDVPLRSKLGNLITIKIMQILHNINLQDTQTGLRVFGIENAKKYLSLVGEGYEFETNMLISSKKENIPLLEVPINTIYIDDNSSSHFDTIRDSFKIYKVILFDFVKYSCSSLFTFFIDISLFQIFFSFIRNIFGVTDIHIYLATVFSRIISSTFNYNINKKLVFKQKSKKSVISYFSLVVINMMISAYLVNMVSKYYFHHSIVLIKILIDTILYVVNFIIQKQFIFKKRGDTQ